VVLVYYETEGIPYLYIFNATEYGVARSCFNVKKKTNLFSTSALYLAPNTPSLLPPKLTVPREPLPARR
jgi:hypothetical protein